MDTIKMDTIINLLSELKLLSEIGSKSTWAEIYVPLLTGLITVIAFLVVGFKQAKVQTQGTIYMDTINQLRKLMLNFNELVEKGILYSEKGELRNHLPSLSSQLHSIALQFNILLDSEKGSQKKFTTSLSSFIKVYEDKLKNLNYTLVGEYWSLNKESLFSEFDKVVRELIKKL